MSMGAFSFSVGGGGQGEATKANAMSWLPLENDVLSARPCIQYTIFPITWYYCCASSELERQRKKTTGRPGFYCGTAARQNELSQPTSNVMLQLFSLIAFINLFWIKGRSLILKEGRILVVYKDQFVSNHLVLLDSINSFEG